MECLGVYPKILFRSEKLKFQANRLKNEKEYKEYFDEF